MVVERCKGCELCIPACRPGVLRMTSATNHHGFHYPELLPGCTACRACYEVCPDFVFDVFRYETPIEIDAETGAVVGAQAAGQSTPPAATEGSH
jgi:2-oxoglutarate ferredoxin oxidoreductase subunit delta